MVQSAASLEDVRGAARRGSVRAASVQRLPRNVSWGGWQSKRPCWPNTYSDSVPWKPAERQARAPSRQGNNQVPLVTRKGARLFFALYLISV